MLTPEKLKRARELRDSGQPWDTVANIIGVSAYKLRGEMDPQWMEYRRAQVNRSRDSRRDFPTRPAHMRAKPQKPAVHIELSFRAPHDVIADRDRRASLEPRSITAALLGDPLPGMSALDRKCRA